MVSAAFRQSASAEKGKKKILAASRVHSFSCHAGAAVASAACGEAAAQMMAACRTAPKCVRHEPERGGAFNGPPPLTGNNFDKIGELFIFLEGLMHIFVYLIKKYKGA